MAQTKNQFMARYFPEKLEELVAKEKEYDDRSALDRTKLPLSKVNEIVGYKIELETDKNGKVQYEDLLDYMYQKQFEIPKEILEMAVEQIGEHARKAITGFNEAVKLTYWNSFGEKR